jgi:hypothetical protein
VLATIAEVYVVETDGGSGDKLHLRAFEQRAVAAGASADNQGVGALYHLGRKLLITKIYDLGKGL